MAESSESVEVAVGDRTLRLSNLNKILYPEVGFTKAQVIDYYARIAVVMLPHITGRCITMRRWPNGVDEPSFFEKRCPGHRPDWLPVGVGPGDSRGGIEYCRLEEPAALVWTANLAALELHGPMARCGDIETPTTLVFDLDPGSPASMAECCRVALVIRDILSAVGLDAYAKTSGSKGLQLYIPLNRPHTHRHAADFAHAVGRLAAKQEPDLVVVEMNKSVRSGKVFVDWSQNSRHKTTIAPYSLRAKAHPTVSTPVRWDEVQQGGAGAPLWFEATDVLNRVDRLGDLFAPVADQEQDLPMP
jgi:bifunctional non-homologous end joining protein LigD